MARANRDYEPGLERVKARLGAKADGSQILAGEGCHQLKETLDAYEAHFRPKMGTLSLKNGPIMAPRADKSAS